MPDKSIPPTVLTALYAALLAGIIQVATITLLALKFRRPQVIAAFVFSSIFGGLVTVLLLEQLKWPPYVAGSIGTASGMAPAILVPFLALKGVLKKFEMNDPDLAGVVDTFTRPSAPTEEVKPDERPDA